MNQQKQAPHLHLRSSLRKKRNCFSCDGLIGVIPQKESDFLSLEDEMKKKLMSPSSSENGGLFENAYFLKWKTEDVLGLVKYHPIPCIFAASLLFFMGVEYTLRMVPSSSPPFDLGFVATLPLHRLLASRPILNSFLAGLNTVFVGMQTVYILWTWMIEGRPRATISALFMFTCRGILGYLTQLPVPEVNKLFCLQDFDFFSMDFSLLLLYFNASQV